MRLITIKVTYKNLILNNKFNFNIFIIYIIIIILTNEFILFILLGIYNKNIICFKSIIKFKILLNIIICILSYITSEYNFKKLILISNYIYLVFTQVNLTAL